jgi:LacI family transcriptional regulator
LTYFVIAIAILDTHFLRMRKRSIQQRSVAVCIDTRDGAGRNRLHGVAQFVRQQSWRMMLVRQRGKAAAQEVARLQPDGIIAYIADPWLLQVSRKLHVPLVDTALTELPVPMTVSLDNKAVGRLAAEHLEQLGLKSFGYCGVDGRRASEQRRACFAAALGRTPLAAFAEPIAEGESALGPLLAWLKQLPKPVGLLVFDDKLGERVLTACRWAELAVPHQVAVLGIGDDELMCELSWPTLSSIRLPTPRLGFEAAKLLAQALQGGALKTPHRKLQPTGVVARGSTDMVAVDDALVKAAVQFIRTHAGGLIGVEQIAQALDVSRRTLDRRFAELLGRSVHEELDRVRMQTARRLLTDNSRPIADLARACGYSTAASFSRAFHHHSGSWPSEYREEATRTLSYVNSGGG